MALLPLAAVVVGCATPTTGIVPRGEGMYTVTRQGEGFWVTPDALKAATISIMYRGFSLVNLRCGCRTSLIYCNTTQTMK